MENDPLRGSGKAKAERTLFDWVKVAIAFMVVAAVLIALGNSLTWLESAVPSEAAGEATGMGLLMIVPFLLMGMAAFFYLLPSIVATHRKHHNSGAIIVLNLLLGWTFLGWVLAMVWAFTSPAAQATQGAG